MKRSWIEVSLPSLQNNFHYFVQDKPENLHFISVVKCNAYGHGAEIVAKTATEFGARYLGVACVSEALELREKFAHFPIFIFGERTKEELKICVANNFTIQVQEIENCKTISEYAQQQNKIAKVHLKIDTGLGRYGVDWCNAFAVFQKLSKIENIEIEGIMTHLAQSDSDDKSYALLQWQRFQTILQKLEQHRQAPKFSHICNTCAYLDLPEMHCNMVRIGMLPLGVYPSESCRRIASIQPVLSVKSRVVYIKNIEKGEFLGYGMHFQAPKDMCIAIVAIGYGDGYPRLNSNGYVLISGQKAPIVGRNSMDATTVDISHIPNAKPGDITTLVGIDGHESISVRQLAKWSNYSTYQVLSLWTKRMEYQIVQ